MTLTPELSDAIIGLIRALTVGTLVSSGSLVILAIAGAIRKL